MQLNAIFFSIYRSPNNKDFNFDFWIDLLKWCSSFPHCIVCGDFNAHSPLWGGMESNSNRVGRAIESAVDAANLACLNDGSPTWFSPTRGRHSTPDITLSDMNVALQCTWFASADTYGSDHSPILISYKYPFSECSSGRPSLTSGRINWAVFSSEVKRPLESLSPNSVNCIYIYIIA